MFIFFENILFGEDKAQAAVDFSNVGRAVVTMRHTTEIGAGEYAATTNYTARAIAYPLRISLRIAAIGTKPIQTPLQDISAHIINAEFVRILSADIMCRRAMSSIVPCNIAQSIAAAVFISTAHSSAT